MTATPVDALCRCESSPPGSVDGDGVHCLNCGGHFRYGSGFCVIHGWTPAQVGPFHPPAWVDPGRILVRNSLLNGRLRDEIEDENLRQIQKWGNESLTPAQWLLLATEEFGELAKEMCRVEFQNEVTNNPRVEAIQCATLLLKIAEMGRI